MQGAGRIDCHRGFGYDAPVLQFDALIAGHRPVAEAWRELVLEWNHAAGAPRPGQFLTLRASHFSDPLLRRPFAFSGYGAGAGASGRASLVYQVRGGATKLLAELAPGARIDTLGPLGNGFPEPREGELSILAGGGIGLGPLLFLASDLTARGKPSRLVLGFRSASFVPELAFPEGTVLCTDDGSTGFHGTPVQWISHNVSSSAAVPHVYGCGPTPMLAALASLAADRGWPASLSAEQWMACGVGACMGCALPATAGGYLRACADGPVFEAGDIAWGAT